MRIAVTGASSFMGAHFAIEAAQQHEVVALHLSTPLNLPKISSLRIDLTHERARKKLEDSQIDLVVHFATKIKISGVKNSAEHARKANKKMLENLMALQKPILYASSTAVHWNCDIPYVQGRREEEAMLRASALPYAILRPSAPYGPKLIAHKTGHKESFHTLVDVIRYTPVVPIISKGDYLRQPIHVQDFARAALALIDLGLDGQEFDAGGAQNLSMRAIVQLIAQRLDKKAYLLPLPKKLYAFVARWHKDFEPSLLEYIDQDERVDNGPLIQETGLIPRGFEAGLSDLLG